MYVCMYACNVYMYTCIYVNMFICTNVDKCIYANIFVFMYICVYVYM